MGKDWFCPPNPIFPYTYVSFHKLGKSTGYSRTCIRLCGSALTYTPAYGGTGRRAARTSMEMWQ